MWMSQLQTETSISSNDSSCIAIRKALRKIIPIIDILKKMKVLGYNVGTDLPTVLCNFVGDNSRALTLAQAPAVKPRKKHINVNYHHFSSYVTKYTISILPIESDRKPVDMKNKLLNEDTFGRHRRSIMLL